MGAVVAEGHPRDLVQACQRGERDAFRALFEAHKDKVYSIALRYAGDESLAMDIAQEVFLKLFSAIGEFRGEAAFSTWVYRLVVNCCMDHRRRSWRLIPIADDLLAVLRAPGDSLDRLLQSEMRGRVRRAVEALAPELRMVVVLRYTEGLSYEQIAEILNCAQGTVASRLNRAHKALERRLARREGGSRV
jgi:RNA polymerase sigma-70 factor (ECF subfamily)